MEEERHFAGNLLGRTVVEGFYRFEYAPPWGGPLMLQTMRTGAWTSQADNPPSSGRPRFAVRRFLMIMMIMCDSLLFFFPPPYGGGARREGGVPFRSTVYGVFSGIKYKKN